MARRGSLFEDLVHLTARAPWWAGCSFAVISYLAFHRFAAHEPAQVARNVTELGEFARDKYLSVIASFLQYLLPCAFLLGALCSVIVRLRKFNSAEAPTRTDACPVCNSAMVNRVAKRGANAGKKFLGCSTYP
jgi:restriction system protein